jgi:molybdate transport system regulatory protein
MRDTMKPTLSASPLDEKTRFRVQIKHAVAIGPGKADVLQWIAETGSLAEAGRRLGMSYQRVWSLVSAMNADFVEPLVVKQRGGVAGGGAQLTPTGERVLTIYRAIERDAQHAVARRLPQLLKLIRPETRGSDAQNPNTHVGEAHRKVARVKRSVAR